MEQIYKKRTVFKLTNLILSKKDVLLMLIPIIGFALKVNAQNNSNDHPEKDLFYSYKGGTELIDQREINSKTFLNPDGSLTKDFSEVPMHYHKNGHLLTYSNDIESVTSDLFKLSNSNLPITHNPTSGFTEIQIESMNETISYGENSEISFYNSEDDQVANSIMAQSTDFFRDENIFIQADLWDNIDRRQKLEYYSTKTDYLIKEKPSHDIEGGYLAFTETYELPNNWYVDKGNGTETDLGWQGELIIFNEMGENMFTFLTPYFYDDSYEIQEVSTENAESELPSLNEEKEVDINQFIYGSFEYQLSGNKLKLSTNVPGDWLLSENRAYPVTIDPTLFFTVGGANIPSCFWTGVSTVTKNCQIPPGSEVIESQTSFTYRAQNGGWMSESYTLIEGNNATYQWFRCAVNAGGNCGITPGAQYNDFANGLYPTGEVPITIGITRVWGGTGCNDIYSFIFTNTWETSITFNEPITLPVSLTSFNASCENENFTEVTWETASEVNASHFIVERSRDGVTWSNEQEVDAAGNSNVVNSYAFEDHNAGIGFEGYYRLRQVDFDGEETVYGPISVQCDEIKNASMEVFPNPSSGNFTLRIFNNLEVEDASIAILDVNGKIIHQQNTNINNGITTLLYDQKPLVKGMYYLRVVAEGFEVAPKKLVIN